MIVKVLNAELKRYQISFWEKILMRNIFVHAYSIFIKTAKILLYNNVKPLRFKKISFKKNYCTQIQSKNVNFLSYSRKKNRNKKISKNQKTT